MDGIGSFTSSTRHLFSSSVLDFTGSSLGRASARLGKWAFRCLLGLCWWPVYYYCSTWIVIGDEGIWKNVDALQFRTLGKTHCLCFLRFYFANCTCPWQESCSYSHGWVWIWYCLDWESPWTPVPILMEAFFLCGSQGRLWLLCYFNTGIGNGQRWSSSRLLL